MPGTVAAVDGPRVGRDGRDNPLLASTRRRARRLRARRRPDGVRLQLVEGRPRGGRHLQHPSTLPASVSGPCAALAETIGLNEIKPKNTSSWVDERQRIVVDAQREAELLGAAQQGAPADITAALATMQAFAEWISTTVANAASFSEVNGAIDAYPNLVPASLAVATVTTWRKANCPQ
jgi:hypothetical protein